MGHQAKSNSAQAAADQITRNGLEATNGQVFQAIMLFQVGKGAFDGLANFSFADEPVLVVVEVGKTFIFLGSIARIEDNQGHSTQFLHNQFA